MAHRSKPLVSKGDSTRIGKDGHASFKQLIRNDPAMPKPHKNDPLGLTLLVAEVKFSGPSPFDRDCNYITPVDTHVAGRHLFP